MIDKEIFTIFDNIEKGYKSDNELTWGNYFSQIDWDIINGKLETFVKNTNRDCIKGNLERCMSHELWDEISDSYLFLLN